MLIPSKIKPYNLFDEQMFVGNFIREIFLTNITLGLFSDTQIFYWI